MKPFRIHVKQRLNCSLEEAWNFLSDPKNLKVITPDSMGFQIVSGADKKMFEGQVITYKVRPLFKIPLKWVSKISGIREGEFFIDEQLRGPYRLWRHQHILKGVDGAVEMEDIIDYALPLGFLGRWIQPIFVKGRLEKIFAYRKQKLDEIFNQKKV